MAQSGRRHLVPVTRMSGLVAFVVLAAVAAVGVVLHPWRSDATASDFQHPSSVTSLKLPGTAPNSQASSPTRVSLRPGDSRSARTAVATYLRARRDGDVATSYQLLSPASRRGYPSQASWLDAVPDLPAPESFTVLGGRPAAHGVEVSVDVRRTAALDGFLGFVPAHAVEVYRATRATRATTSWRVDAEPVRVRPDLVSDRTAAAAVSDWLGRLAACDQAGAAADQVTADLLGDDSVPAKVCATQPALRAEPAIPMTGGPDTASFLAAYGPDIGSWARLVPVSGGGQRLLVGVAPMGPAWRVFGIVHNGSD